MHDPGDEGTVGVGRDAQRVYDGKRMRKPVTRRTVDHNATIIRYLENRIHHRDSKDVLNLQPDIAYVKDLMPSYAQANPATSICTRFVQPSINKGIRHPINAVVWTPDARWLITGGASGEFTLWDGMSYNFQNLLQAHDSAIRAMKWKHDEKFLVTADHDGVIKYWETTLNNCKAYQGHDSPIRDLSFAPTDQKFATCSDDCLIKIWDFGLCREEIRLEGHGWDAKCVSWHPQKALLASGAKDSKIKLWDPRKRDAIATLHSHKKPVLDVEWNNNGNWLLSSARDQLIKITDIRTMREYRTFKGHKKEVTVVKWHPWHEELFVSGGYDGAIYYWFANNEKPAAELDGCHDSAVWDLAWHPLGHVLCSGSHDQTSKFWCRNRPGDTLKDNYTKAFREAQRDLQFGGGSTAGFISGGSIVPETTPSSSQQLIPGVRAKTEDDDNNDDDNERPWKRERVDDYEYDEPPVAAIGHLGVPPWPGPGMNVPGRGGAGMFPSPPGPVGAAAVAAAAGLRFVPSPVAPPQQGVLGNPQGPPIFPPGAHGMQMAPTMPYGNMGGGGGRGRGFGRGRGILPNH